MPRTIAMLLAASLVCPGGAPAQGRLLPSVPQTLSLADAIELATRFSPALRQFANDRGPAAWRVRNAYASFLPRFDASGSAQYSGSGSQTFLATEFEQPSSTIGSFYSLNLSMSLSGRTLTQPGLARAQLRAAEATITGAQVNLESAIRRQYLAVLQAEAQVELAELQVRRNEEFLKLAQARFDVGQNTMLEVRQAEVAKGQAEVALIQARQAVTVEKLRLFQQMGIVPPEDPSVVTLSDTFPIVEPVWALGELLDEAEGSNPDLLALRASGAAARATERAVKSTWLPTLSFSAGWSGFTQQFTDVEPLVQNAVVSAQRQADAAVTECNLTNQIWLNPGLQPLDCSLLAFTPAREDSLRASIAAQNGGFPFDFTNQPFSARLSVSLPIFTQFSRPQQVAEAAAAADDAIEMVRARELQVQTEVSQAYYAMLTAYETIGIQESNRAAAREQLRLATERYRVGSGTSLELLDAQVAAQRAEADYVNAVYQYHQAIATLESAVGRPLR
ncbi:MAG: TolC family protein [Gemmatimonadales bacterium]